MRKKNMKRKTWKTLLLGISSGAILLQTASCAATLTALSTSLTAGGVFFIIARILEN